MTVISKHLFYDLVTKELDCRIIHPWNSNCIPSYLTLTKNVIIGASKFYTLIYFVSFNMTLYFIYVMYTYTYDIFAGSNPYTMEESKQIFH